MLADFLDKYGVEWSKTDKHSRHSWTQARPCPRCSNDRFHLGIQDDFSRSSCYTCGSFHVPKLLKDLTDAPWSEIYKLLGNRAYVPKEADTASGGVYTPPTLLEPLAAVPAVAAYLKQRNFDLEYLETVWGVRATGPFSNHPFRVFMPIYLNRKAVSWTARAACGQEPRYRNAGPGEKSMDEKTLLFGAQYAKDAVIIVEGPFDSMAIGKGAVATLGIAVTTAQVNRLADYYKRVIVFDNEPNAQRRARALADQLSIYPGETFIVNIDAKDPAEAKPSEIAALRKFAGI
jgi:hypothetical protein